MAISSIQIPGYEILRPLGAGGMSTVYLAVQRMLDRKVAIKVMRRAVGDGSPDNLQGEKRFLLEGRMMAKLPHRNIVAVYDIVSSSDIAYIAMEYLPDGSLADRMRKGIALADAISVIVQIAAALEFAHNHGVVHRDLKPANILFRDNATPVLTDFGIARYQDGNATRLTQTGMLVGTPTYMSPEQINGQSVDGRADQYSLGILFYELLAGSAPFRGESPIAVLMAHLNQQPAPLPEEFHAFQGVLDRMLAKNRDDRYADLKEFSNDLKSRLVHSETLLMRLQLDPNQTSSEQLRELGFYTTTPTEGALHTGPVSLATPDSGLHAFQVAAAAPVAGAARSAPRKTRRLWPVVAAAAVVAVVALGAWLLFGYNHLNRDERELVNLWNSRAAELIAAGHGVVAPPHGDGSALDFIRKVEEKDPSNARAHELRTQIEQKIAAQVTAAIGQQQFDQAQQLDQQGLQALGQSPPLLALKTRIEQAREAARKAAAAAAQTAAQREAERQRIAGLLDSPTPADWASALTALVPLLTADPGDSAAQALRQRGYEAFEKHLRAAQDTDEFDATASLLKSLQVDPATDTVYAALMKNLPAWRDKLVAAARAKIAAMRGELALNATPWAQVESVVGEDGQTQKLPADAETPLLLKLPAGNYTVTFRQPLNGGTRHARVHVLAQKRAEATVAFDTITAREYFSHAGW